MYKMFKIKRKFENICNYKKLHGNISQKQHNS